MSTTTATTTATTVPSFTSMSKNIGLIVLGAVIMVLHAVIFQLNQYMFTIIMCIYIIGYTILVIVLLYKNKSCFISSDLSILLNMSFYTVFLEVFLIILTVGFALYRVNKH